MGLVTVVNHRDSRVVLSREARSKEGLKIEELVLQSGANHVDADILKSYRVSLPAEQFFKVGLLSVAGAVVEGTEEQLPEYGGDLAKLKLKAALRVIDTCTDPRQLKTWVQQDGRPEIRKALLARHEQLNKGDTEQAQDAALKNS